MKKRRGSLVLLQSIAGAAASCASFLLLSKVDDWPIEPRNYPFALAAVLPLVGAALSCATLRRGPWTDLPRSGEVVALAELGLSPRERLYVLEYAAGKTHKEIAAAHHLAHSTVRNGISSAYKKLGLASCAELKVLAATRVIVDGGDQQGGVRPHRSPPVSI